MACGTPEVAQTSRCKDNDAMAIWEDKPINLWLYVFDLDAWEALDRIHLDLVVKVTDVANNGVVLHLLHVFQGDDLVVSCARDEDVGLSNDCLDGCYLESFHAGLERTNRIALSDEDASAAASHGEGTALANITIASNKSTLASDHDIGCSHYGIWQGVAAAVHVVELGLSDAIVH